MYTRSEDERGTEPGNQRATSRELAMLRAIAAGRAELVRSCEPDLYIDGLCCCDQYTAHQLARRGLLRASAPGRTGERVPAELTATGRAFVTGLPVSA